LPSTADMILSSAPRRIRFGPKIASFSTYTTELVTGGTAQQHYECGVQACAALQCDMRCDMRGARMVGQYAQRSQYVTTH
jgi:hypothetical protein